MASIQDILQLELAPMGTGALRRSSLGTDAALGDLYNARKESFCHKSLSLKIEEARNERKRIELISSCCSDELIDRFKLMNVEEDLWLSVLLNDELPRSYTFLTEPKKSSSTVVGYILFRFIKSVRKSVLTQPFDGNDEKYLVEEPTHFVAGVISGAQCILTIEKPNISSDMFKETQSEMKKEIIKGIETCLQEKIPAVEHINGKHLNLKCKLYSDNLSTDVTGVSFSICFMQSITNTRTCDAKPFYYLLLPLDKVPNNPKPCCAIQPIDGHLMSSVVAFFDYIQSVMLKLQELNEDLNKNSNYLKGKFFVEMMALNQYIKINSLKVKRIMKEEFLDLKKGSQNVHSVQNSFERLVKENFDFSRFEFVTTSISKIKLVEMFLSISKNITYIGKNIKLESVLSNIKSTETYLLLIKEDFKISNPKKLVQVVNKFLELSETKKNRSFVVIDLDIKAEFQDVKESKILLFKKKKFFDKTEQLLS